MRGGYPENHTHCDIRLNKAKMPCTHRHVFSVMAVSASAQVEGGRGYARNYMRSQDPM